MGFWCLTRVVGHATGRERVGAPTDVTYSATLVPAHHALPCRHPSAVDVAAQRITRGVASRTQGGPVGLYVANPSAAATLTTVALEYATRGPVAVVMSQSDSGATAALLARLSPVEVEKSVPVPAT